MNQNDPHKAASRIRLPAMNMFIASEFTIVDKTVAVSTGIKTVESKHADNVIYTLDGVRHTRLVKGINIVNGKKVIVK